MEQDEEGFSRRMDPSCGARGGGGIEQEQRQEGEGEELKQGCRPGQEQLPGARDELLATGRCKPDSGRAERRRWELMGPKLIDVCTELHNSLMSRWEGCMIYFNQEGHKIK